MCFSVWVYTFTDATFGETPLGFLGGSDGSLLAYGRPGFHPWVRKIPWRREWQPTPVFLPGESHGQRSLEGHSLWGHRELDTWENRCPPLRQPRKHAKLPWEPPATLGESSKRREPGLVRSGERRTPCYNLAATSPWLERASELEAN